VVLEDLTGRVECTLFPDLYEQTRELLDEEAVRVISGKIEDRDDRGLKLLVSEIVPFEQAKKKARPILHLEIQAEGLSEEWFRRVDEVLSAHPGMCEVHLHISLPDRTWSGGRSKRYRVAPGERVTAALRERFPGLRARWEMEAL
jgi:DNA polymerase-3 subunit alpha